VKRIIAIILSALAVLFVLSGCDLAEDFVEGFEEGLEEGFEEGFEEGYRGGMRVRKFFDF